jgi:uncharacterized protein YdaU (DUF1376 family)
MQLYTSDYLADTAHLTTEEHGAYLLLLMNYWQRAKPLDNSNGRLAHVARLSAERWAVVEPVLAEFFTIEGDTWTQARIERDLDKIRAKSSKLAANGSIGGSKRQANAKQMPIYEEEEEDKEEDEDKDNKKISSFDNFWSVYPRKTAKGAATAAWVKALKKATAEEIIKAAEVYRDDPNRDEGFTAHASTWLNQERWLDGSLPQKSLPMGSRGSDTRTTVLPPRYTADEAPKGSPMPENIRQLLGASERTQIT